MPYKLVIANKIVTKVKGQYKDVNGDNKNFSFELTQDRITQDDLSRAVTDKTETAAEFIKRVTTGWKGQQLVLDDSDKPAEFNAESFDALLSIAGMAGFCFQAYVDQVLVTAKN